MAIFAQLLVSHTPQPGRISWGWLIGSLLLATGIAVSWLSPATRTGWDTLDLWVFEIFDGSIRDGHQWQLFWAYANHRKADVLAMVCFGLVFLCFVVFGSRSTPIHRLMMAGFAAVATTCFVIACKQLFGGSGRLSPSLVVEGAVQLTNVVQDVRFKDVSRSSFPGDHGVAVIFLATLTWAYVGYKAGLLAVVLSIAFALPRVVVGAHWATDVLVGSFVFSIPILAVLLATPLQARIVDTATGWVELAVTKAFRRRAWNESNRAPM